MKRTFFVPAITLDRSALAPLREQIQLRVALAIQGGALPHGARLPSSRLLATLHSPSSVKQASAKAEELKAKIAVVAGASRGCGRGIAVALGEQAAIVYVTGRTTRGGPPPVDGISGVIEEPAEEVTRREGAGIPVQIDHCNAGQCKSLFDRVRAEHGRVDIFACAVWGGNERFVDPICKPASHCWVYCPDS